MGESVVQRRQIDRTPRPSFTTFVFKHGLRCSVSSFIAVSLTAEGPAVIIRDNYDEEDLGDCII